MVIKTASVRETEAGAIGFGDEEANVQDRVRHMTQARGKAHDRIIAECLCTAAAWAYSDVDTFARMMHRRGGVPYNETVRVTSENSALLVDTTAFVTQSRYRDLVVLSFGGTHLSNLVQLLMDATVKRDQFWTIGNVHGGFFRAALALWPTLKKLLHFAIEGGGSICDAAESEREWTREECRPHNGATPARVEPGGAPGSRSDLYPPPSVDEQRSAKALYITGHSLGGALAVITAAIMYQDPDAQPIWRRLRSIYTYGQPMVGSAAFADGFKDAIGRRLFRHVYGRDLVPGLPSWFAGEFQHIGTELYNAQMGWMPRGRSTKQSLSFVSAMTLGIAAFALEQLPRLRLPEIPLLSRLHLGASLHDHLPINYLRTSMLVPHGSEFM